MATDEIRSQEWVDKIEGLVRRAEAITDPQARGITIDLLQAVMDFHGVGLNRLMQILADSGAAADPIMDRVAADELTSSMLLLHDLHPEDLETRVQRAVRKLDEMFASLGAKLTLVAIETGTVRVQFDSPRTWSGSPVKASVEGLIFGAAPEISTVVIEGLKETPQADFVPLSDLLAGLRL